MEELLQSLMKTSQTLQFCKLIESAKGIVLSLFHTNKYLVLGLFCFPHLSINFVLFEHLHITDKQFCFNLYI